MNRGIIRTCLFLCLVLAALLVLRALPAFTAGGYEIKTVDFLVDLLPEDTIRPIDMAPKATAAKVTKRDTCPVGMTCIEDYADSTLRGMAPFYKALASRYSMGRPVRIAYFGDSFIEGDILTADLRALLQRHYGGNGVGFVDIASPFTKLRTSVKHRAIGWTEHNVLEKKGLNMAELGVTCRYARGGNGASVSYSGVNDYNNLRRFDRATLYLSAVAPLTVSAMLNGADTLSLTAQGHGQVEALHVDGPMSEVTFTLGGRATCYGVALEDRQGVILDNFSLRGSSGTPLAAISPAHLHQLSEVRPYDLIVLQFGLNVASKKQLKYDYYIRQMKKVIANFKSAFPKAGILVVSIGDREDRINGQLCTMPGVKALINYQQMMAMEEGIAFWNLYEAMGGEGAMRRMADARPAEAGRDYTHINRRGGKRIAGILFKALVHGFDTSQRP